MDRYLYKAKRLDNGEWVQGVPFKVEGKWVLLINDNENLLRAHYIEENMWTAEIYAIEVDSTTICQCTGLKDKNGKLIWENDIVKCLYDSYGENGVYIGKVIYREDTCCFVDANSESTDYEWWEEEKEVIGNIFDNKELLESEEK